MPVLRSVESSGIVRELRGLRCATGGGEVMGLRILWSSNAPWATSGYGVQSKHLLPRLQALGHQVAIHAWYGLQGGMLNLGEMPIYPMGFDTYGNDIAEAHYRHFKADMIISLIDVWVLRDFGHKKMRWIPYMPIDHDPIPEAVTLAIEGAYRVVSYAHFGERLLNAKGVANTCIPHGVETKIYTPGDRHQARERMQFGEDDFVIGMVAANKGFPSRKAFPENLQAVALFKARHPRVKIKLYLHTLESTQHGGIDFDALLQDLGFTPGEVTFVHQYRYIVGLDETYMAMAYNAMDVLLAASMSEGFGIPIVEAQACGTPVITTNFSSMPELTGAGWLVDAAQKYWSPMNSWQAVPSVESIAEKLDLAWRHRTDSALRAKARAFALDYDWDAIVEHGWKPFLEEIERSIKSEGAPIAAPALEAVPV